MKNLLGLVILLSSAAAMAAGGGGSHDESHIPLDKIAIQAINLGILLIAIFFFVKKSIVDAFAARQVEFKEQSIKTAKALEQAENELKEIKTKLKDLEQNEAAAVEKAKAEAELLKSKIVVEAEAQAKKMKEDISLIVGAELYKAKNEIRKEIIEHSMVAAQKNLESSAATITKNSEKGFLSDLGQVKA